VEALHWRVAHSSPYGCLLGRAHQVPETYGGSEEVAAYYRSCCASSTSAFWALNGGHLSAARKLHLEACLGTIADPGITTVAMDACVHGLYLANVTMQRAMYASSRGALEDVTDANLN
jgi:hypothetical protein